MEKPSRIALIESDDLIRQLATRWLISMGYQVQCVTANGRPVPSAVLVIADIANPRKAGAMVRSIRAVHSAPILLVSARFHRTEGPALELAEQLGVAAVLAKPYSKHELQSAVAAALNYSDEAPP